jgi:hypothetical protein
MIGDYRGMHVPIHINTHVEVSMRKVVVVLTVVFVMLVGPVLAIFADAPQGGGTITDCRYSEPTQFPGGTGTGQIAERFSTLRSSPGAFSDTVALSPATFDVLAQNCIGGFSWVNIRYTSGTACNSLYWDVYFGGSCDEFDATGLEGWALESQIYFDGTYGPGRWLEAAAQPS